MPGFLAGLRVDLETGDGVVVMANATSGLGPLGPDLLTLLREREPVAPTPWSADSTQSHELDLVGPWYWGTYAFNLSLEADGGLRLGEPGRGPRRSVRAHRRRLDRARRLLPRRAAGRRAGRRRHTVPTRAGELRVHPDALRPDGRDSWRRLPRRLALIRPHVDRQ
ncbi:hypothetical protein [Aeromicrobium sp. UC242_57]|uniref:DUF7586 domain-containing protein n=1 Tax=Aeromicrobium sp. UC242_57 TaxID=3374624 RepID=UPI0037A85065